MNGGKKIMPLPPALQENNPFAEFKVETAPETNPFADIGVDMQSDANPFAPVIPEISKPTGQEIPLTAKQQAESMASLQKKQGIKRDILGEFATQHPLFPVFAVTMPVFEASYQVLSKLPRFSQSEMGKKIIASIPEEATTDIASIVPLPFFKTFTGAKEVNSKQLTSVVMDATQNLGALLAAGKIEEGVSKALVENSVKILGGKLTASGYGEARITIPQETLDKIGKYTPSGEAILENLRLRRFKVEVKPPMMGMPAQEEVIKAMDILAPQIPTPASKVAAEVKAMPSGPKTLLAWTLKSGRIKTSRLIEHLGKEWKQDLPFSVAKNEGRDPSELYTEAVGDGVIPPMPEGYTGGEAQYFFDQLKEHKNKALENTQAFEDQIAKEYAAFKERNQADAKPIEGAEISGVEKDLVEKVNKLSDEEVVNEHQGLNPTFKTPEQANTYIDLITKLGGHAEIMSVSPDLVEVSSTVDAGGLDTNALEVYIDTQYEIGTPQVELDKLETIYAQRVVEEELNMTEEELGVGEATHQGADLEEQLTNMYHRYLHPEARQGMDVKDILSNMRSAVETYGGKGTDEQLLVAAKDIYEHKQKLIEKYKLSTPTGEGKVNPFAAVDIQPTMPPKPLQPAVPQTDLPLLTELKYGLSPQVQKTIFDNAIDAEAKLSTKEKAGRVLLPGDTPEGIKDPKLRAVLYAGRKRIGFIGSNLVSWLKDAATSLFEGIKLEYEPTLRDYPQLQDDIRTGPVTFSRKAREQSELALGGLTGNLNNYQEDLFLNIIGMQDLISRGGEGIKLPQDLSADTIKTELDNQLRIAPKSVLDAVAKYNTLMKDIGMDLVAREKLGIDELKTNYFPHYVLEYMPAWWDEASAYLPKKLRKPYGAYLKKAVGSTKDIAITKEALAWHLSSVFMDNAIDDWAIEQLTKYDKIGLSAEQLASLGPVKPNELKTLGGKQYKGFQYVPGRHVYPAQMTNPSVLNKALEEGMTVEDWQASVGPKGGAAVTQGLAMGRYNKVYLLPIEIYNRFNVLKTPWGDNPFLSLAMPATALWKRVTLDWAGIPFQVANFFGDFINLYRTAPGAAKEVGMSLHILKHLRTPDKLSPWQQKVLKIAHDKDVLGAGFVQEYAHISPFMSSQGILEKLERWSSLREGLLRMAMLSYQMKRAEVGLPFVAPEFSPYIQKLDKVSAAAYIARKFTVDYLAIPDWYRRWVRGFAAPFITFYQVNAKNWAKYVKNSPIGFIVKFLSVMVGLWAYNNTGDRKNIEERLPDYWRWRPFHVILKSTDLNHDGIPDRALIWAPQTPVEMSMAMIGMDRVGDKITMIRAKRMTIKEAALQQMVDIGLGSLNTVHSLLNPMIQFFEGILSNRDPRTKQEVVPSELSNISENAKLPYRTRYFFEKMFAPYGQYLKESKGIKPESWGILTGPLDITRAFGFYTVNLTSADARIEMDANRKLRGDYDTYMYSIERRYVDGRDYSDIEKEAAANGINITARNIYNRVYSTRVQLDKIREDMRNAKDALTRRRLEIEYDNLIKQRAEESIKQVPRGARP